MPSFEDTNLWQSSLARQLDDKYEKEREKLRDSYDNFRKKAGILAGEINRDLPDFTIHDITHLDALWEMASSICGPEYKLNPAEAYVLGGAFLIHDLGMGLAAYPDGISELQNSILWADSYAYYKRKFPESEAHVLERSVKELVLRELHAKHAAKLALIAWGEGDKRQFLIDDYELREAYGETIGLIAHSHWLNSESLESEFTNSHGALGSMPPEWTVNPLKLACIMRVADASHIDDRRATSFLKLVRQPNAYSAQHWDFQAKLYRPRLEGERLFYSSKSSFNVSESNSWWFCRDTLKMIDSELIAVDSILSEKGLQRLRAKGVASIGNIDRLKKAIKVDGWDPIDASIHVGDVARLVSNLGGEQLYGNTPFVAIRELIQNACDAVKARRVLDGESPSWGKVTVTIGSEEDRFIEVEDNGVGMSSKILTKALLNFGTSFWGSPMMHKEFPGLESKGFSSTGRFGVGFFSTFMLGGEVIVTTCRAGDARSSTKVLEFTNNLDSRPILRSASDKEWIRNGGTRVRVHVPSIDKWRLIFDRGRKKRSIKEQIKYNFPALDVDLHIKTSDDEELLIANSWKELTGIEFIKRVVGETYYSNLDEDFKSELLSNSVNLSNIFDSDGNVVGRGFIHVNRADRYEVFTRRVNGVITVGGARTNVIQTALMILEGDADKADRESATPKVTLDVFQDWLLDQEKKVFLKDKGKIESDLAASIRGTGIVPKRLPVAYTVEGWLDYEELKEFIRKIDGEIIIVSLYSAFDIEREGRNIIPVNNAIVVDSAAHSIVGGGNRFSDSGWDLQHSWFHARTLNGVVIEAIADLKECSVESVLEVAQYSDDEKNISRVVGYLDEKEHRSDHVDIVNFK